MSEQRGIKERGLSYERDVSPNEFLKICKDLIPEMYELHEKENGPESDHEQIFHRVKPHISVVVERVEKEIRVIREVDPDFLTPVEEGRALLFASLHDLLQYRDIKDPNLAGTIREEIKRRSGPNENDTAERVVGIMRDVNDRYGKRIFTSEDVEPCRGTMAATIAPWNGPLNTVVQDHFNENTPIEGKLLALADIGAAGCDPEHFMDDGLNEFKEVRTGITRAVKQASKDQLGGAILVDDDGQYIIDQGVSWLWGQVDWVNGRESRIDEELGFFEPTHGQALRNNLYNRFGESRELAQQRAQSATGKPIEVVLEQMKYAKAA